MTSPIEGIASQQQVTVGAVVGSSTSDTGAGGASSQTASWVAGETDVVATLLAKDPDDRYQNGEALAADLRGLGGDPAGAEDQSGAEPVGLPRPARGRQRIALAGRREQRDLDRRRPGVQREQRFGQT